MYPLIQLPFSRPHASIVFLSLRPTVSSSSLHLTNRSAILPRPSAPLDLPIINFPGSYAPVMPYSAFPLAFICLVSVYLVFPPCAPPIRGPSTPTPVFTVFACSANSASHHLPSSSLCSPTPTLFSSEGRGRSERKLWRATWRECVWRTRGEKEDEDRGVWKGEGAGRGDA